VGQALDDTSPARAKECCFPQFSLSLGQGLRYLHDQPTFDSVGYDPHRYMAKYFNAPFA
jgi:hypothetical protein